jgi:hypothetical protein
MLRKNEQISETVWEAVFENVYTEDPKTWKERNTNWLQVATKEHVYFPFEIWN